MDPVTALRQQAAFLDALADKLDGWARETLGGGWSTHQVKPNQDAANDCRRQAAQLRTIAARL